MVAGDSQPCWRIGSIADASFQKGTACDLVWKTANDEWERSYNYFLSLSKAFSSSCIGETGFLQVVIVILFDRWNRFTSVSQLGNFFNLSLLWIRSIFGCWFRDAAASCRKVVDSVVLVATSKLSRDAVGKKTLFKTHWDNYTMTFT